MKKLLLAVALIAGVAVAGTYYPQRVKWAMVSCPTGVRGLVDENGVALCGAADQCAQGTCTGTAPTSATDGMNLSGLSSFRLTVCAPNVYTYTADGGTVIYTDGGAVISTQYLSGAGSEQAYVYSAAKAAWSRDPELDKNVTVTSTSCTGSGCACQAFPDFSVGGAYDRVKFVPSGVTMHYTDGGTNDAGVETLLDGQTYPAGWSR